VRNIGGVRGGSASRHSGVQDGVTLLVTSKRAEKWSRILRLKARETEAMPLVTRTPMALEIGRRALTNRVKSDEDPISFTPVRNEADCAVYPS
jgi:hypothetical protein